MTAPQIDPAELPAVANGNHGMTTAAWVTNGGIVLGAIVAAVGLMIPQLALAWVGGAIIVVGLIAGAALRALGHGQPLK